MRSLYSPKCKDYSKQASPATREIPEWLCVHHPLHQILVSLPDGVLREVRTTSQFFSGRSRVSVILIASLI
jgi:hypothetical protein